MTRSSMHFERQYEFASTIVWDALVDSDLVSGWLGDAYVTARLGGEYSVQWLNRDSTSPADGRICGFEPFTRLDIESAEGNTLEFQLAEVPGGSRGTSTILSVDITAAIDSAFSARVQADWLTNLDQLADLLRGHPVDWQNWERDRAVAWAEHLDEVEKEARP